MRLARDSRLILVNKEVPTAPDLADPSLRWKPISQYFPQPVPQQRRWLNQPGSLTEALKIKSDGDFRVQVTAEHWLTRFSPELVRLLGNRGSRQRIWSRKVVLFGRGKPWVMAHTMVPQTSLNGPLKQLRNLHSKPLGEFLFRHPGLKRSAIEVSQFRPEQWGRRSLYLAYGRPILVAEYFLPDLFS